MRFGQVETTAASRPQLHQAKVWLEQEGRWCELNALISFLDEHEPRVAVTPQPLQEKAHATTR